MIDIQPQTASAKLDVQERISQAPSEHLLGMCRAYLELVDHGTLEQQDTERTRAHNELIQQMVAEGFVEPSPHRVVARWLARYFVQTNYLQEPQVKSSTYVMFMRCDSFPVKLESLPPFYEQEEESALAYYTPVRVTIEPLLADDGNVESQ